MKTDCITVAYIVPYCEQQLFTGAMVCTVSIATSSWLESFVTATANLSSLLIAYVDSRGHTVPSTIYGSFNCNSTLIHDYTWACTAWAGECIFEIMTLCKLILQNLK